MNNNINVQIVINMPYKNSILNSFGVFEPFTFAFLWVTGYIKIPNSRYSSGNEFKHP